MILVLIQSAALAGALWALFRSKRQNRLLHDALIGILFGAGSIQEARELAGKAYQELKKC